MPSSPFSLPSPRFTWRSIPDCLPLSLFMNILFHQLTFYRCCCRNFATTGSTLSQSPSSVPPHSPAILQWNSSHPSARRSLMVHVLTNPFFPAPLHFIDYTRAGFRSLFWLSRYRLVRFFVLSPSYAVFRVHVISSC